MTRFMRDDAKWLAVGSAVLFTAALATYMIVFLGATSDDLLGKDSYEHDFGTRWQGDAFEHVFRVENDTDHPYQITEVKNSCGCTIVRAPTSLPPRSVTDVPLRVSLEDARDRMEVNAALITDQDRIIFLRLTGNVLPRWPKEISFGTLKRGEEPARDAVVRFRQKPNLDDLKLEYNHSLIQVDGLAVHELDGYCEVRFVVRPHPMVPYGKLETQLIIKNLDAETPQIIIQITGTVLSLMEVSHQAVTLLPDPDSPGTLVGEFDAYSPYGESMASLEVSSDPQSLKAIIQDKDPSARRVRIRLDRSAFDGRVFNGEVVLHAKMGQAEVSHRVQVYALVK